jgi:quinol monooxygenase YgiN
VKTEYRVTAAKQKGQGEQVMIVEYIRYRIDEQKRADFEKAYQDAGAALDVSRHCQAYELTHCTEAAENYILRIEWDSEEGHMKGFRASPEFKTFFAAIQPYVKDIEEMRHYQLTLVKNRK